MFMRPPISGSTLERVLACPPSAALPQLRTQPGEAAAAGSAVHWFLEQCSKWGRERALVKMAAHKTYAPYLEFCELIDLDELPLTLAAELAFCFDTETGIVRQPKADYSDVTDTEIPCRRYCRCST
jgi:hypothetical protein